MKMMTLIALSAWSSAASAQQPPLVSNQKPLVANTAPLVAPATPSAPVDPARLSAARALLDVVLPPAKRDAMIDSIMKGMMANLAGAMQNSPQMKAAYEADPRAGEIFSRFFQSQQARSLATLKANFPDMIEAMTRAYARRFTAPQMVELRSFFMTPTGQAYVTESPTIVNDPDVAKWQRDLMANTMAKIPAAADAMMAEIRALPPKGK